MGTLARHTIVGGYRAKVHQLQPFTLRFFFHNRKYLLLFLLILGKKHQACSVLSLLWYRDALQQNELMRNLNHDASAVARSVTGLGSTMLHVLQHLQGVVHQFMAFCSMNVYHHAHATRIMFVGAAV